MYGIIGEDDSDAKMLKSLVRRIRNERNLPIETRGCDGCGNMITSGAKLIRLLADGYQCKWFIICHDADQDDPKMVRENVLKKIVKPSGLASSCCIVVPVREIEAWILADIGVVTKIFKSWKPSPFKKNPESIPRPKEYLENLSRDLRSRPRYFHSTHNPQVAEHLDLEVVRKKCPSFHPFYDFLAVKHAWIHWQSLIRADRSRATRAFAPARDFF